MVFMIIFGIIINHRNMFYKLNDPVEAPSTVVRRSMLYFNT